MAALEIVYLKWTSVRPSGQTQNGTWNTLTVSQQSMLSYPESESAPDGYEFAQRIFDQTQPPFWRWTF